MECYCNKKLNHIVLIGFGIGGRGNSKGPQGDLAYKLGKWKEVALGSWMEWDGQRSECETAICSKAGEKEDT